MAEKFREFVYIFGNDEYGLYKIGTSQEPIRRMRIYESHLPFKVKMFHTVCTNNMKEVERILHEAFSDKRAHGEWFSLDKDDLAPLKRLLYYEGGSFYDVQEKKVAIQTLEERATDRFLYPQKYEQADESAEGSDD